MKHEHKSKAICVDFDGVIAELSPSLEDMGQVIPGAVEGIRKLRALGYKIIIHTARPSHPEHVKKIEEYLKAEGVPYDEIGVNSDCEWESVKPLADLYIDDRALRFEGNWNDTFDKAMEVLNIGK